MAALEGARAHFSEEVVRTLPQSIVPVQLCLFVSLCVCEDEPFIT